MKDYLVQVKIKNNPLYTAMVEEGFETSADLARAAGVSQTAISEFLNLRRAPLTVSGEWRVSIIKIARALNRLPEGLFPPQHLRDCLVKNTGEFTADLSDIHELMAAPATPFERLSMSEASGLIDRALRKLSPRYERALRQHYWENKTLKEIGDGFGVSANRARQIVLRAERMLGAQTNMGGGLTDAAEILLHTNDSEET